MKILLTLIIVGGVGLAQIGRTVTLMWYDSQPGVTYSIYIAPGDCTGSPVFALVAVGITVKNHVLRGIVQGQYCFTVTASYGLEESVQATPVTLVVPEGNSPSRSTCSKEMEMFCGK
jgi:hypothetical protein